MITKKTYSDKLKNPRWQKKRLEIMQRDNFACKLYGDTESTLAIHHLKYSGDPWDAPNKDLITVCEGCHALIPSMRRESEYNENMKVIRHEISEGKQIIFIISDSSSYMWVGNNGASTGIFIDNQTILKFDEFIAHHKLLNP